MQALASATIGQIGISVRDIERAVEFYRDKLGLRFLLQASGMAFFDCGGIRLLLGPPEDEKKGWHSSIIYFKVNEIESAVSELRGRGVIFDRDAHLVAKMPDHDLWMAIFRDPDQNALALMCEVKP
jgi:methylmalonyl-CoA/ethylmalonyl-CoA epimerase